MSAAQITREKTHEMLAAPPLPEPRDSSADHAPLWRRADAYVRCTMKMLGSPWRHVTPFLVVLALAITAALAVRHAERGPEAAYALAGHVPAVPRTPYGSSAAVRALLF